MQEISQYCVVFRPPDLNVGSVPIFSQQIAWLLGVMKEKDTCTNFLQSKYIIQYMILVIMLLLLVPPSHVSIQKLRAFFITSITSSVLSLLYTITKFL